MDKRVGSDKNWNGGKELKTKKGRVRDRSKGGGWEKAWYLRSYKTELTRGYA